MKIFSVLFSGLFKEANLGLAAQKLAFLCSILVVSSPILAQDTHHWSNQFGTRAALLGGAVLTDTVDNAGVYYNPGNLAFLDTSSISINANLYGLQNIEIENALGQRQNFKGLQFNTIPLLVSGTIKSKSKWNLSYALITPVSFTFNGLARIDDLVEILPDDVSPGPEDLVAESGINLRVQETSILFGIGRRLKRNLGFGMSLVNTFRSLDYTSRFTAKTFSNTEPSVLISRNQTEFVSYWSLRTAVKMGLNYQKDSYGLAFTIQSPGIDWLGNGEVAEDLTITNLRLRPDGMPLTAFSSDRQQKLQTTYKSPFEISIGGHKKFKNSTLSLNVTHFAGIDPYRVLNVEARSIVRPGSLDNGNLGSENFLNVESAMRPVTNFALGYETQLASGLKLLGSFRSDFSYFDTAPTLGEQLVTELTQWDVFHLSLGTIIEKDRSSLTIGLIYSFGRTNEYFQENTFNSSDLYPGLEGALSITQAKYSTIGLLVGYAFRFKKFS